MTTKEAIQEIIDIVESDKYFLVTINGQSILGICDKILKNETKTK